MLVLLLMVLTVTAAFSDWIEFDGLDTLFILELTPGLHATNPWLPSAAATLLGVAANLVTDRVEARKE